MKRNIRGISGTKQSVSVDEVVSTDLVKRILNEIEEEESRQIADKDVGLLNETVYSNFEIFKYLVIRRYHWLKKKALRGSSVASCIIVDIETAIDVANFEPKEQKILKMWMDGHTQAGIAEAVYEYQQNVGRVINDCVERLQYILVFLNPYI